MRFIGHILAIIIIWLTAAAQPDNNKNYSVVLRNNHDETLHLYGFAGKLRPSSKSCVFLIIFLPSLLSGGRLPHNQIIIDTT